MKIFFFLLSVFFSFSFATAQTNFTVSGRITNDVTGQPMPAASVFAQNTTFGTVTDADGNFKLQLPAGGYDLVISYTGFRPESRRISSSDAADNLNITLKEKEKEMAEVAIVSSNEVMDGLEKYGAFFKNEFLGRLADSNQCRIENPEALHFFFSKRRNRLKVTATEPLIIKNNLLGYNLKYTLDSFTHEYNTEVSIYTGYPLFEEMQGDDARHQTWEAARREAYKGSLLRFMRSVYNKNLSQQKFEIQFIIKNANFDTAFKLKYPYEALNYQKDDSTQTVEIRPNQNDVGILFMGAKPSAAYLAENPGEPAAFQFSVLSFRPQQSIVIERNGYFYDQNDLSISGYWTRDKVARQLPYDWQPTEE
jgi:hypothetical protein